MFGRGKNIKHKGTAQRKISNSEWRTR